MPNKRAKGQRGVLVMMKDGFVFEMDSALEESGYSDRSSFIRDAVYEKLKAMGKEIPPAEKASPSRIGVGGRPKKKHAKKRTKKNTDE